MIGRLIGRSLTEFLEFRCENKIKVQPLREFLGDIAAIAAPRIQIHFLENRQIRPLRFHSANDVIQARTTGDIPIQNLQLVRSGRRLCE